MSTPLSSIPVSLEPQSTLGMGPPPLPGGSLRRGSQGEAVAQLQQALLALGLSTSTTDGDFGAATEQAVASFQFDAGLGADGAYGPGTREALWRALARARLPVPPRPACVRRLSPHHSRRRGAVIDTVILHHTGSNNFRADLNTLRGVYGPPKVSAHFLLAPEGRLYQLVSDSRQAWHAGDSTLRGQARPSVNARSLGIEITNDGGGRTPFTEAQYRTLEQLLVHLVRRYGIPVENVLGHREVAPGRKRDPADNFDWARIRQALAGAVG
jgi:N-acetylmuramoyl-L-alanine amidase